MTQEQINASLDKMLANPKSRNFLNHLVRAYMPISNVEKVWDTPEKDFKCVLTREQLFSVGDIMKGIQTEEFKADFMTNLKSIFSEDKTENPIAKLIGEKKMGVTGKDTTTYMSYPAFQDFYNWVITKALNGDKHINWLLGSIRRASFMERAEKIQDAGVQKKVENLKKVATSNSSYTLGDASDVLSKLKAKLENKE
ncbi:MAG: hypothetical protein WCK82_03430 [Bacteroidota bacterium]